MGFDFGGGLELAPEPFEAPEPAAPEAGAGAMDFSSGGGMGHGMELETPMSDFTPEAPPAWMEQDGPEEDDGALNLGRRGGAADSGAPPSPKPRPMCRR